MFTSALVSALAFGLVAAVPVEQLLERANCPSYIIITTRGTLEPQGPSLGFNTMNSQITSKVPGGTLYNTVYPAGPDQDSSAGTTDIVNQINSGLASNPNQCFVLEGYSQGAAATVNAMSKISAAGFNAVKAVVLLGDPLHKSGLACNVDENGGTTTLNVNGISAYQGVSIPDSWVSKTRDICYKGDGICDQNDFSLTANHLGYISSTSVQNYGTDFIVGNL